MKPAVENGSLELIPPLSTSFSPISLSPYHFSSFTIFLYIPFLFFRFVFSVFFSSVFFCFQIHSDRLLQVDEHTRRDNRIYRPKQWRIHLKIAVSTFHSAHSAVLYLVYVYASLLMDRIFAWTPTQCGRTPKNPVNALFFAFSLVKWNSKVIFYDRILVTLSFPLFFIITFPVSLYFIH